MNEIHKQRLVGALILIALAVVFWPIIFVEPGDGAASEGRRIPDRPVVNTEPIPAPTKATLREPPSLTSREQARAEEQASEEEQTVEPAALPVKREEAEQAAPAQKKEAEAPPVKTEPVKAAPAPKTRTEAPTKPKIDAEGVPVAWILQVASVSSAETAESLRKRLIDMGHKAYVKKIRRGEKLYLRVYIGPKFERKQLEKIQSAVDAEFGVTSMVVRYIP